MSQTPPTRFSTTRITLNRLGRRLFWPRPALYYPFGLLRNRGSVFDKEANLYISGYPRCGNTFARTAFLFANPAVRILSHRHIPAFDILRIRAGMPGLVLIRNPLDAAVSWAIHEEQTLEEAIAYWNDYYETLLPYRANIFIARFEDVTSDFGAVMKSFNTRWGTSFVPFEHTPENAASCFRVTDEEHREPGGAIREMQVCRPSAPRRLVKETHLRELTQSDFLRDELIRARELYITYVEFRKPAQERAPVSLAVPAKTDSQRLRMEAAG